MPYLLDQGALGDFSSEELREIFAYTLEEWNQVDSSKLIFEDAGFLEQDIKTGKDFRALLKKIESLAGNPVVFDDSGKIFEDRFGKKSQSNLLGVASPVVLDDANNEILRGFSLYNGSFFKERRPSGAVVDRTFLESLLENTILHEEAHKIGLSHVQGGFVEAEERLSTINPLMFPFLGDPDSRLKRDDIAMLSEAYPSDSFADDFGTIRGKVLDSDAKPVLGMNIVAYKVDEPIFEFVSGVSDQRFAGDGSYVLSGLIAGDYILKVEKIDKRFDGSSFVGPHLPNRKKKIPEGFWNGLDEVLLDIGLSDALEQAERINITAGELVDNLDLILGQETFVLKGKAAKVDIDNSRLFQKARRRVGFLVKSQVKGRLRLQVTVDGVFKDAVSVNKDMLLLRRKGSKRVQLSFASLEEFQTIEPSFSAGDLIALKITITDLDSGYTKTLNLSLRPAFS